MLFRVVGVAFMIGCGISLLMPGLLSTIGFALTLGLIELLK